MHLLSFDLEEWFHVFVQNKSLHQSHWDKLPAMMPDITRALLDRLSEHNAKASFFCMGWVASKYPELIRDIDAAGHEVAAHSYWHKLVHQQNHNEFKEDLMRNIETLQQITGKKVISYRAPAFTLLPTSGYRLEALLEAGIKIDSSAKSGVKLGAIRLPNNPFVIQGSELQYYPVSTFSLFGARIPYAGSGYFRMLPFDFVNAKLKSKGYHMLYFHPRDLDNKMHQRKEYHLYERLRFIPGTGKSLKMLEILMTQHKMHSIRDCVNNNWIVPVSLNSSSKANQHPLTYS